MKTDSFVPWSNDDVVEVPNTKDVAWKKKLGGIRRRRWPSSTVGASTTPSTSSDNAVGLRRWPNVVRLGALTASSTSNEDTFGPRRRPNRIFSIWVIYLLVDSHKFGLRLYFVTDSKPVPDRAVLLVEGLYKYNYSRWKISWKFVRLGVKK